MDSSEVDNMLFRDEESAKKSALALKLPEIVEKVETAIKGKGSPSLSVSDFEGILECLNFLKKLL